MKSHWETEPDNENEIPFALKRLHKPANARRYDFSGMGCGNDIDSGAEDDFDYDHDDENDSIVSVRDSDGKVVVRKMCLKLF